jgi:hypothetical protein
MIDLTKLTQTELIEWTKTANQEARERAREDAVWETAMNDYAAKHSH